MFADKLPPGGYGALGMIWEPGHDTPIGFSKKTIWGVSRVGDQLRVLPHRQRAHERRRGADDRARRRRRTSSIRRPIRSFSMPPPAIRGSTPAT